MRNISNGFTGFAAFVMYVLMPCTLSNVPEGAIAEPGVGCAASGPTLRARKTAAVATKFLIDPFIAPPILLVSSERPFLISAAPSRHKSIGYCQSAAPQQFEVHGVCVAVQVRPLVFTLITCWVRLPLAS